MIDCARIQAALSARLDGEPAGLADDIIDAHVGACEQCQQFLDSAALLNRQLHLNSTPTMAPDLSEAILVSVEPEFRRQASARAFWLVLARTVLVILGIVYVLWAGHTVAVGDEALMDVAALRATLAFGLFFAAWRPDALGGFLPLYGAYFTFTMGFHIRELVLGTATWELGASMVLLLCTLGAMLVGWLNGFGFAAIAQAWRALKAQPRS